MVILALGLFIFMALHLVPTSPELKSKLVGSFGEIGYKILMSIGSLVGLVLIIWGYGEARFDTFDIWEPPHWMRHVTALFMIPVFPLLVESQLPGKLKAKISHPMLMAVKIWAFSHLLANGDAASMLLFGTFLMYGVYAMISAKKRQRAGLATVTVGSARNDIIALVVGLVIYGAFAVWGHPYLIGVPVV